MEHGCCCDCFVCKIGRFLGLIGECEHKKVKKVVAKKAVKKSTVKKKVTKKAKK